MQSREPTNSTHIWRRIWELNPGHIGGRRVLSPLRHLCTPPPPLQVAWNEMLMAFWWEGESKVPREKNWKTREENLQTQPTLWWLSGRAEISLCLPGWNIVVITCLISAWTQNANFHEKIYWGVKITIGVHACVPLSAWTAKVIAIKWIFQSVCPGVKSLPGFISQPRIFNPGPKSSPGWNLLHVIATFILRGFLSEPWLKS